ncbi:hypothetical protein [Paracoccus lutimaris]|uniref:Uncharacterized protein n=1 Tax=Paracoccus lutimaris TaxID=1490030 RepID=A0A368YV38_9RHOB|nr:hypothetical protein [Paracoccus lutimaris]RCW84065.1 hypothetical protein DFP89_1088 [Paracoccus lutimaris]
MKDEAELCRDWVEIHEESGGDVMVFRPSSDILPPSRRVRRRLELASSGAATGKAAGPNDAPVAESAGSWSREGRTLHVALPGWSGDYDISELTDDRLVLKKR